MKLTKKFITIMGPIGSGKDTQAGILASKIGFPVFSSTKALEEKFRNTKPEDPDYQDMMREKEMWEKGILLTPEWVAGVVNESVGKIMTSGVEGVIFSGSPRTLPEAEIETKFIQDNYGVDKFLLIRLHMPAEESIKRNNIRLYCENNHPLRPEVAKSNPEVCPDDGGKIKRRELDHPDVNPVRIKEYETRTVPAIEYIEKLGVDSLVIEADQSIEDVADNIWRNVQKFKADD